MALTGCGPDERSALGFPRAMGAALLVRLLSLLLPAEARQPDAGRTSTLIQQSILRDKNGLRTGRINPPR
jgi:hypothetical protein